MRQEKVAIPSKLNAVETVSVDCRMTVVIQCSERSHIPDGVVFNIRGTVFCFTQE